MRRSARLLNIRDRLAAPHQLGHEPSRHGEHQRHGRHRVSRQFHDLVKREDPEGAAEPQERGHEEQPHACPVGKAFRIDHDDSHAKQLGRARRREQGVRGADQQHEGELPRKGRERLAHATLQHAARNPRGKGNHDEDRVERRHRQHADSQVEGSLHSRVQAARHFLSVRGKRHLALVTLRCSASSRCRHRKASRHRTPCSARPRSRCRATRSLRRVPFPPSR